MWSAKFGNDRFEYGQILKDMQTSLYEEEESKSWFERGDSIDDRNVQHTHKRDYIRKLTKEAKPAEKAVKGLQSMMWNLESKISNYHQQFEKTEQELISDMITLNRHELQKADMQKPTEYQTKLAEKADKLHSNEQELERLTADVTKAYSVILPFRNSQGIFHTTSNY